MKGAAGVGTGDSVPSQLRDLRDSIDNIRRDSEQARPGFRPGVSPFFPFMRSSAITNPSRGDTDEVNDTEYVAYYRRNPRARCRDREDRNSVRRSGLQAQGQLSRLVARAIDESASQLPALCATLLRPGVFLDVGTGAGWLAIEVARTWPALRVVGIDPWQPALTLARKNLADSGVADRIELRSQRVEHLKDAATFTLAWLPGPFIAGEIADHSLAGMHRALAPGGWLILRRLISPSGERVSISNGEFGLLAAFLARPERILTRDQLLDLSRLRSADVYDRSVDAQIMRLRRKIEVNPSRPQLIKTERGLGYRFCASVAIIRSTGKMDAPTNPSSARMAPVGRPSSHNASGATAS